MPLLLDTLQVEHVIPDHFENPGNTVIQYSITGKTVKTGVFEPKSPNNIIFLILENADLLIFENQK